MELKDLVSVLISLSASLVAMSFGFGGQREKIRQIVDKINDMTTKHQTQVNPVLQDLRDRLIKLETEFENHRDYATKSFERIEKNLETILSKL
jgi:hypothetical protein